MTHGLLPKKRAIQTPPPPGCMKQEALGLWSLGNMVVAVVPGDPMFVLFNQSVCLTHGKTERGQGDGRE